MTPCSHLDAIADVEPSGNGCVECLLTGGRWVHLRRCTNCGHIGCCDNSPGKHATGHFHETTHPLIQSFEPGEDWYWCYVDEIAFEDHDPHAQPIAYLMVTRLVVGVLLCVVGGVWFLQGIGVLEGSFMTGEGFWTVVGVILLVLGLRMIIRAARAGRRPASRTD